MVINYCLDCLDFDGAIDCIIVVAAPSLHMIDDTHDDLRMDVSTVEEHFAVCHVSHYSLFLIKKKKNIEKRHIFTFLLFWPIQYAVSKLV